MLGELTTGEVIAIWAIIVPTVTAIVLHFWRKKRKNSDDPPAPIIEIDNN